MQRRLALTQADVLVAMVLVTSLATLGLAQLVNSEEIARRVKCASNLRQIGQAILLYSNDNRGAFPRTVYDIEHPTPTWGTPYEGNDKLGALPQDQVDPFDGRKSQVVPKPNDVTAALFLLLRTQDITSEVFICPSAGGEKWDYGGGANSPLNSTNWHGNKVLARTLSFSLQNPYASRDAIAKGFKWNNAATAEFAVASDMNPGVELLLKLTPDASAENIRKCNSPNHGGEGQNVLYGDGHVQFEQTPFCGVKRDNIFTCGDSGADVKDKGGDAIVGSPVGPDDSILLPTARDLDVINADGKWTEAAQKRRESNGAEVKPATPQEQEATRKAIAGTFVRSVQNRAYKLTLTADRLQATSGPMTLAYDCKPLVIGKGVARLTLTAPDTEPSTIAVRAEPDGSITINGNPFLEGTWKKQ